MICSAVNFFPRAISRPPLVCNHQRFSLWKWRRLRGAGRGAFLAACCRLSRSAFARASRDRTSG
jgi:hypothetical protein